MKISNLTESVKSLLEKSEKCRSDDRILTSSVWWYAISDLNIDFDELSAKGLLDLYMRNLLPNHDSITRARRKVQEDNPSLRGLNYKSRQDNQEAVKADLGYTPRYDEMEDCSDTYGD